MTSRHQPPPPLFDSPAHSPPRSEDVPGPLPSFPYGSSSAAFAPQLGRRFAKNPRTGWKSQWDQQQQQQQRGGGQSEANYRDNHNQAVDRARLLGQADALSLQQAQHHTMHSSGYSSGAAPDQTGGNPRDNENVRAAVAVEMSDLGATRVEREASGSPPTFTSGASPAGPAGEKELEREPLLAGLSQPQALSGAPQQDDGGTHRSNSGGSSREPPGTGFPGMGPGYTVLPSKHRTRVESAPLGGATWHHQGSALHTWGKAVAQWWSQTTAGVDLSADILAIAMVYFVQGVLGLARLAINFFLKDELGLDPDEVWFNLHIVQYSSSGRGILKYPAIRCLLDALGPS